MFSLSHAAQLDLGYAKVSRDKLGHVGSEPYLNDDSGRKWQQTGSEIGGDLFFGDPPHRRRDRGLERPDFDLESIVSPTIWLRERRPSTVPLFAHAKTGRSIGGLSRLNRNVWPPYLVIIAVCYKRPGFAFRKMASLPMMYIYVVGRFGSRELNDRISIALILSLSSLLPNRPTTYRCSLPCTLSSFHDLPAISPATWIWCIYIYTYIVFHKYHYFLQETGRLSSLTNSINLYSPCCTFASSSHPTSYPADIL